MKLIRWLWPLVAAGAVVSLTACSGSKKCGPSNCATGCCDSTSGLCVAGSTTNACGTAGITCGACGANQVCQQGQCVDGSGGCNASNCTTGCCSANACVASCPTGQACNSSLQCVTPAVCNAANCNGCCNAAGECIAAGNQTLGQCGATNAPGASCMRCNIGQSCTGGQCTGGQCDTNSCSGCCTPGGSCIASANQNVTVCGIGGLVCVACGVGQVCSAGACITPPCNASTCQGCCSAGVCVPTATETTAQCGAVATAGAACVPCNAGQTCTGGACTGGPPCSSTNCANGCCVGNTCVAFANQNRTVCGTGGATCAGCPNGDICSASGSCQACTGCITAAGACVAGTSTGACGAGGVTCATCTGAQTCTNGTCTNPPPCMASNCPNGCCPAGGGACVTGTANNACGAGGNQCVSCLSSQMCQQGADGGACITVKLVGDPCAINADCATVGSGAFCKLATGNGLYPYPGGYCTVDCTDGGTCPTSSECLLTSTVTPYGEKGNYCLRTGCASFVDCRAGYNCYATAAQTAATDFCWIDPPADAGYVPGAACSAASDPCGPPPGTGFCIPAVFDGGPTGFPGGSCFADCTAASANHINNYCGDAGFCFDTGNGSLCVESCAAPMTGQSTCRANYVCTNGLVANGPGFCESNCANPGNGCPNGLTCSFMGYCCQGSTCF